MGHLRRRALYALAVNGQIESLVRSIGVADDLAYRAATRYVAGRTLDDALETVRRLADSGLAVSLDLFGEGVEDEDDAARVADGYRAAAAAVGELDADVWLEIVPSHLGLDLGHDLCRQQVERIVEVLPAGARLQISAEESHRTPGIMDLSVSLADAGAPVVATVQANLRRSPADVDRLMASGIPVRLVKGAYLESSEVAHAWGEPTELAYLALARQLHDGGGEVFLATHDAVLRESLLSGIDAAGVEMLLGVREDDAHDLARRGVPIRVYAPYGEHWFRYWMRRVAESQGG